MNPDYPNSLSNEQTTAGNIITAAAIDLAPVANSRIGQQEVKPQAVKDRNVAPLVTSSHNGLGRGQVQTALMISNTTTVFTFSVRDNLNRTILAVPDVSLYLGSVSAATQYPYQAYGMGNMPIAVYNDWGLSDNVGVVTRFLVRNNSGADVTGIAVCRWRIITNPANSFDNQPTN